MRTIIVSSDPQVSRQLAEYCSRRTRNHPPVCLHSAREALHYAERSRFEAAIVETGLPDMPVDQFCHSLCRLVPECVPVFITEGPELAAEAFRLGAADYLVKPFTAARLGRALDRAEKLCCGQEKTIRVRTFGHFDLFVRGHPVHFRRQKSKEILAYLVDRRGGMATTQQILSDLWEDKAADKSAMAGFQTALKGLREDLDAVGAGHILICGRNQKAIDHTAVDCDYYRLMEGSAEALESFPGQYMAEYSWAEPTNANCCYLKQQYEERQRLLHKNVEMSLKNR